MTKEWHQICLKPVRRFPKAYPGWKLTQCSYCGQAAWQTESDESLERHIDILREKYAVYVACADCFPHKMIKPRQLMLEI